MPEFNKQLERFQPSAINTVFSLASRLKAEGKDIIDLSIGEPDFDTPKHIKQAAIEAIEADQTKYTPSDGANDLKQAVINKLQRDNNLSYNINQIAIDSGVKPLLFHVMKTILDEGNEVIVPTPCWTSYPGMVMLAGGEPVFVACPQEKGFKLQAADLEAAINENTRLVILNSPSNPTGAAYSLEEMKALTDVLLKYPHVWVIADDIYEHIVFDGFVNSNPAAVEPKLLDRTIVLNGVSKAYCMTGWRIGYAASSEKFMQMLLKVLSQATGCPCSVSQAAAIAALDGPQQYLQDWAKTYQERRDYLVNRLDAIEGIECNSPEGAFYLYPGFKGLLGKITPQGNTIKNSIDFVSYLLEQALVAVVPGSAFEYDNHFRLSYATSLSELEKACDRIELAVEALS
ncbi:pyridoxal phosphate-dependent aminotransferase [Colwellia sp. PAMC 21821]|uniref:pyridoxal phosphate-dependent aminotransferase n=1 Tax=Colwellia sp. PAMC 21821 TaxID=1816219 RepID=UPI0009BCC8ED|nr:pyridoxal phosphate-dependent aminotransferase [Colwellia sp. PAMC 21821]ARD43539.1 aspartate aminotransferase [Colwellia sp. PAMC 21821]